MAIARVEQSEASSIIRSHVEDRAGPWTTPEAGVLPYSRSDLAGHIASPHADVDADEPRIRMVDHVGGQPSCATGSCRRNSHLHSLCGRLPGVAMPAAAA